METGDKIPDNIVVDKVLMVIIKSQAYKEAYKSFKALPPIEQDFAHVKTHFTAAERLRKECDDTAQDQGYSINAEEVAIEGARKGLTDLANNMHQHENNNAVVALLEGLWHVICQLLALVIHLLLHLEQPISDFLQNAVVRRLASCIVVIMLMHVIGQVRQTLCSSFYDNSSTFMLHP